MKMLLSYILIYCEAPVHPFLYEDTNVLLVRSSNLNNLFAQQNFCCFSSVHIQ